MNADDIKQVIQRPESYAGGFAPETGELQAHAKRLCWEYNQIAPDEAGRRRDILRELFGDCPEGVTVEPDFRCDYGFNVHFEGFAFINYNCVILDTSPVRIGAGVFLAPGVCLACAGHAIDPGQRPQGIETSAPITIGEGVWIGANAVVCGGVSIVRPPAIFRLFSRSPPGVSSGEVWPMLAWPARRSCQ